MFYDFVYLAKGFQMRPKVRSTLSFTNYDLEWFFFFNQSKTAAKETFESGNRLTNQ